MYGLKRSGFKKQRERPLSLPYYGHTLLASALSTSAASFSRQSALIYSILARLVALPGTDVVSSPGRDSREIRSSRLAEATQKPLGTSAL